VAVCQYKNVDDKLKEDLQEYLPGNKNNLIKLHVISDPEALTFGNEINEYLISNGWENIDFAVAFMATPFYGMRVKKIDEDGTEIKIGYKPTK
jgi:hypothetical protein